MDQQPFNVPTSAPRTSARWEAGGEVVGVPELILIGHDAPTQAIPLPVHHHGDAYEFVFMERGTASWRIGDEVHETRPGHVLCTRPYELHCGVNAVIEPSRFWWMVVKAPRSWRRASGWAALSPTHQTLLAEHLDYVPRLSMIGLPVAAMFTRMRDAIRHPQELSALLLRVSILEFLLLITSEAVGQRLDEPAEDPWARVAARLTAHADTHPPIEELAESLSMSPSYFNRQFSLRFGLGPVSYWTRQRLNEAAECLTTTDDSITAIATQFGYASSQHFATAFRKRLGCTPSEWRDRHSRSQD